MFEPESSKAMDNRPLYSLTEKSSPTNIHTPANMNLSLRMDSADKSQSMLENAQQFSRMAVLHMEQVRRHLLAESLYDHTDRDNTQMQALEELTAAYDKLSKIKWDMVRREYEASCRRSVGVQWNSDDMGAVLERSESLRPPSFGAKTPGKKRSQEEEDNDIMTNRQGKNEMNPHDWIADAFRNGAFSSLEMTNGKDAFSFGYFPSLDRPVPSTGNGGVPLGISLPPPGFVRGQPRDREQYSRGASLSFRSSEKSEDKDTTQSTSTPSEISSLHTHEGSCCDEEDGDESSIESLESCESSPPPPEGNFDYVYKGGYAMKVSNGKETKGIVPKNVKDVLVHSSVTSIEEGAFQGCNELESVTIASSVVNIRDKAFRKCSKLKKVIFLTRSSKSTRGITKKTNDGEEKKIDQVTRPHARRSTSATTHSSTRTSSQLRTIGEWAFFNCSSLKSINLPIGLETIGSRAFQRCSLLDLEEVPVTLLSVGENAFYGCSRQTRALLENWERNRL
ncbi:hypothetical protein HJC23_001405 [Cyclotella cryptica]|uniref:Uncharacterized protein n=1 Tax=Cyclotella cryptica TaxID=29204 RepID=A0ABD3PA58_9STRA